MTITIILFVLGLALLLVGGESMVRGAAALSKRCGLSPLLIGVVVVGFGTSVPELTASLSAVCASNAPGIAMGNVIGSNCCNILLIIGLSALIAPISGVKVARRDLVALVASAAAVGLALFLGWVPRILAAVMVVAIVVYLIITAMEGGDEEGDELAGIWGRRWFSALATVAGIVLLLLGAHLMVSAAVKIAAALGVADSVIGLTIVALGTSLPELAASIIAAAHKQSALAVGNIIGSNIFNALFIPGVVALVKPFPVAGGLLAAYLVMVAATLFFCVCLVRGKAGRIAGAVMAAGYLVALGVIL